MWPSPEIGGACGDSGQHVALGRCELSWPGRELRHGQGWRCRQQEEALWFMLLPVLGALRRQVPQLGDPCLGTLSLRSPCGLPLLPCSLAPITLWERHPSPVPVNPDAAAAQRVQESLGGAWAEGAAAQ